MPAMKSFPRDVLRPSASSARRQLGQTRVPVLANEKAPRSLDRGALNRQVALRSGRARRPVAAEAALAAIVPATAGLARHSLLAAAGLLVAARAIAVAVAAAVVGRLLDTLVALLGIAHRVRLAGMVGRDRQLRADDPLDRAQLRALGRIAQRDGDAVGAVAARAADAVDIALRLVGQVEIHHMADAGNVDAARGDVGRHEDAHRAVAEAVERLLAGVLATCCRG